MTLIVENGTGLSNADAFIDIAFADAYNTSQTDSSDWASADIAKKENAIRRATSFLTAAYSWKGLKINGRDQALSFPRSGLQDRDGYDVDSASVPDEIKKASVELAQVSEVVIRVDIIRPTRHH